MEEKKMELMYDLVIKGITLTKPTLIQHGFNESEIKTLLEDRVLIETNYNTYRIYSLYELYEYGLKLTLKNEGSKANQCFARCHQLDHNNREFALEQFYQALKLGDFTQVFQRYSEMEKIESEKNQVENNLYLYLLSLITSCSEEYKEKLSQIDYDSVLYSQDNNVYNKKQMNDIGNAIMKQKYGFALETVNTMIAQEPVRMINYEILKALLIRILTYLNTFYTTLLSFADLKKYYAINSFLERKSQNRYLSNKETYIYMISKAITDIQTTGNIPQIETYKTRCLYQAIKGNNFALAKNLGNNMAKKEKRSTENQIINKLLRDINQLIYSINQSKTETPVEEKKSSIEEIADYLRAENTPLDIAQQQMNLTDEQALLIKLIYARDYYIEEMYLLGDTLLKEVEKSDNKTPFIIKKLNEIRINKKLYKNRKEEYSRKRQLR